MPERLERKLSAKTIVGATELRAAKQKAREGAEVQLFSVIGAATEVFEGETATYGSYRGLIGEFETTNIATGEVKYGNKIYLPEPAHSNVAGTLKENERVGFALIIGVKFAPPEESEFGFVYVADTLIERKRDQMMLELRGLVTEAVPQIADKTGDTKQLADASKAK